MTGGGAPAIDITTTIPRPPDEIWRAVATPKGVNAELGPYIHMTFPAGARFDAVGEDELGKPLFGSWLLLFGVLPFDRHTFGLEGVGQGWFREASSSWMQRSWRHERWIEPCEGGCTVRDRVSVEPRITAVKPMTSAFARLIFEHRRRRLKALYG